MTNDELMRNIVKKYVIDSPVSCAFEDVNTMSLVDQNGDPSEMFNRISSGSVNDDESARQKLETLENDCESMVEFYEEIEGCSFAIDGYANACLECQSDYLASELESAVIGLVDYIASVEEPRKVA
jgi:hypothetical protein